MRHGVSVRAGNALWDIEVPSTPGGLAGVTMAGFRDRGDDVVDLQVVPYPAATVVIDLSCELFVEGTGGRSKSGSIAAGLIAGPVRGGGRNIECLQIRLSPVVAHAVLGASWELGHSVVALGDLWGSDARRMEEQLRAACSWDDRFLIAEAALARRYEAGRALDPEVAFVWDLMVSGQGQVRVDKLAAAVEWSRKRLWSRFGCQVGLSPKRAAQLIRFDRAVHSLAGGRSAAAVAAETGYADQSHLHRDVVAFAGVTPTVVAGAPWLAVDDVAWSRPASVPV
jgi:AraC-like DNA-binding protein